MRGKIDRWYSYYYDNDSTWHGTSFCGIFLFYSYIVHFYSVLLNGSLFYLLILSTVKYMAYMAWTGLDRSQILLAGCCCWHCYYWPITLPRPDYWWPWRWYGTWFIIDTSYFCTRCIFWLLMMILCYCCYCYCCTKWPDSIGDWTDIH